MSSSSSSSEARIVHLVLSFAPLLSGDLDECFHPDDEDCEGGVAAVGAMLRHYTVNNTQPSLVLPWLDKESPFVQMHPLQWSVNRLVFSYIMGWKTLIAPPSLLTQNTADFDVSSRDISDLQSTDMPYLMTNVNVPPSLTWFRYTEPVYFDIDTGLAVMSIINTAQPMTYPQIESAKGMLDAIARINNENRNCNNHNKQQQSLYEKYVNTTTTTTTTIMTGNKTTIIPCWIPVIHYRDNEENLDAFLDAILYHKNPPQLIFDTKGHKEDVSPQRATNTTWLVSFESDSDVYVHHKITLDSSSNNSTIANVEMIFEELEELDPSFKDDIYRSNILQLRKQADEASLNDPVVGQSTFMPITRIDSYRRCMAGECELGNLYTDAERWWANSDVAFSSSGGIRGTGWPAGDVRVSDIWASLPFPNNMCTGTMNGVSLFKLMNYSINEATFEGEDTDNGDRLLQVSGMRITFNLQLTGGQRIVKMEVYDKTEEKYLPVERLKLYTFATDSWLCSGMDPYPILMGTNLTAPGEVPGIISDADLLQNVVGDFLREHEGPYDVGIKGRLVNDTSIEETLNLIQTADDCKPGTYWQADVATCGICPEKYNVAFMSNDVDFETGLDDSATATAVIDLVNTEMFDVVVVPKSKPSWLTYADAKLVNANVSINLFEGVSVTMASGERMTLGLEVSAASGTTLEAGTAQGLVSFGLLNGVEFAGCSGQDASFEAILRVLPQTELNHLGAIRHLGWALAGIVVLSSLFFTCWVRWNRDLRIVKTLQPFFLAMISSGVLILSLAIVPMSIDDAIASQTGCNIACMASPWLLSMGFTIAMSALFSKLWRINKLFRTTGMRRIRVREKDVMAPFAVLFTLNFIFLLVWTLVEPLKFFRVEVVEGEPWETYGVCRSSPDSNGPVSTSMLALVVVLNLSALFCACYQAYVARNISDEFSESKNMGVALFSWFQLMIVGLPVNALIDRRNPSAIFLLRVLLIFAVSMSMLLLIFAPMMIQTYQKTNGNSTTEGLDAMGSSHSRTTFSTHRIGSVRVSGLGDFGIANFEEVSKELAKLSFVEKSFTESDEELVLGRNSSGHEPCVHLKGLHSIMEDSSEETESSSVVGIEAHHSQVRDVSNTGGMIEKDSKSFQASEGLEAIKKDADASEESPNHEVGTNCQNSSSTEHDIAATEGQDKHEGGNDHQEEADKISSVGTQHDSHNLQDEDTPGRITAIRMEQESEKMTNKTSPTEYSKEYFAQQRLDLEKRKQKLLELKLSYDSEDYI